MILTLDFRKQESGYVKGLESWNKKKTIMQRSTFSKENIFVANIQCITNDTSKTSTYFRQIPKLGFLMFTEAIEMEMG